MFSVYLEHIKQFLHKRIFNRKGQKWWKSWILKVLFILIIFFIENLMKHPKRIDRDRTRTCNPQIRGPGALSIRPHGLSYWNRSPRGLSRKGYQTALQYLNSLYLALLPGGATPGDYNSATCTAAVPWWQPGRVGGVAGRDYLSSGETGRQVSPAWAAAEEGLQGPMLGWLCCISSTWVAGCPHICGLTLL